MKLLAKKVHIQGMEVLLADKVHKQEPQHKCIYVSHNHPYISSSGRQMPRYFTTTYVEMVA